MKAEALQATTADGVTLRGEVVRGSDTWLVLLHDVAEDIDVWKPLRPGLARRGWTVLEFDLRGHGGSNGHWELERGDLDVDLAVSMARRLGARHVCVVATGVSAVLTLRAIERAYPEESFDLPDSLILVSPGPLNGLDPMALRGRGLPRLFLYGGKNERPRVDAQALQQASIGWNVAASFGTDAEGSTLVAERSASVLDKIASFLKEQCLLRGPGQARAERRQQEVAG
jgi:alpha-beta hydrolase superfamily lysophospholipase